MGKPEHKPAPQHKELHHQSPPAHVEKKEHAAAVSKPSKTNTKSRLQQKSVKPLKMKASASKPKQALAHVSSPPVAKKPAVKKPAIVAKTAAV